ncbi:MAG: hypothetical protein LAO31_03335 [Acidobacteriia bacterium]|nr:hypothetical protein [Terriglobia bacterium]
MMQIFGKPPFTERLMIDPGIFDRWHGSSLSVIGFSQDSFYTPEGQLATYKHLTGDPSGRGYFFIDASDAVHGMYYSNPAALINLGNVFH